MPQISPTDILIAVVVFLVVISIRAYQRKKAKPPTR
jgi:hypothetical protein